MDTNRRELLAGLAAVAVAGIVPALPVAAFAVAPAVARRTGHCWSHLAPRYARLVPNIGYYRLTSTWHYEASEFGVAAIRHLPTGLTFLVTLPGVTPQTTVENVALPRDPPIPFSLGYAARSVAVRARTFDDRGAVFVSYETSPAGILTKRQSAPPLLAPGFSNDHLAIFPRSPNDTCAPHDPLRPVIPLDRREISAGLFRILRQHEQPAELL